jgi:hypothetical protein
MNEAQIDMRECPACPTLFTPQRESQVFCTDRCRRNFANDVGATGRIASVRRLQRGVSVVMHFADGPSADRAINFTPGQHLRIVEQPSANRRTK